AVLAATPRHDTIPPAALRSKRFNEAEKLLAPPIPVDRALAVDVQAGIAYAVGVEGDTGPRVGHQASRAMAHAPSALGESGRCRHGRIEIPACSRNRLALRMLVSVK